MPDERHRSQPPTALVACARMYNFSPIVREHLRRLSEGIGTKAGVSLEVVVHAAPAPIETLWAWPDLGCAFMCGLPFARSGGEPRLLAAPVPAGERYGGRPIQFSNLVVRAHREFRPIEDTFGGTIGWTVEHSRSGYKALRHHLSS